MQVWIGIKSCLPSDFSSARTATTRGVQVADDKMRGVGERFRDGRTTARDARVDETRMVATGERLDGGFVVPEYCMIPIPIRSANITGYSIHIGPEMGGGKRLVCRKTSVRSGWMASRCGV